MSKQELTKEQILAMKPGREMDILIAVRVMGYKEDKHRLGMVMKDNSSSFPRPYSTNILAAWEVVEKLSRGQIDCSFVLEFHYERYYARFGEVPFRPYRDEMYVTAPEAICKAALLAVMGGSGNE